jgi:hypothetical protein
MAAGPGFLFALFTLVLGLALLPFAMWVGLILAAASVIAWSVSKEPALRGARTLAEVQEQCKVHGSRCIVVKPNKTFRHDELCIMNCELTK